MSERSEVNLMLDEALKGSRMLSRGRHLELLVFELLACLEKDAIEMESKQYEACRVLYKALVHGRRPDGSKY